MSQQDINNMLNYIQTTLDNMIIQHTKSDEVFQKQISFMKKQHEYSIDKIDRFINLYKSKYPKIKNES